MCTDSILALPNIEKETIIYLPICVKVKTKHFLLKWPKLPRFTVLKFSKITPDPTSHVSLDQNNKNIEELWKTWSLLCPFKTCVREVLELICAWHHRNKQSKCENRSKWGQSDANTDHLMRRFQIWSQNSNRRTFDPFLTKKLENWQTTQYGIFSTVFLAQKGVKCYFMWILRTNLESSIILYPLHHPLDMIFIFLFFDLPFIIWLHNYFFDT